MSRVAGVVAHTWTLDAAGGAGDAEPVDRAVPGEETQPELLGVSGQQPIER